MRRNCFALFVLALTFVVGGCDKMFGGSPTGPGSSFVNPNPGNPIEVQSVTPPTGSTVTEGDRFLLSYGVYTIEGHGLAWALVFLRDDGKSDVSTCGKVGRGVRSSPNYPVGPPLWMPGHEVTVLVLSKDFKSQSEYEQSPYCIFMGPGGQALFDKAEHKEELARYWVN